MANRICINSARVNAKFSLEGFVPGYHAKIMDSEVFIKKDIQVNKAQEEYFGYDVENGRMD